MFQNWGVHLWWKLWWEVVKKCFTEDRVIFLQSVDCFCSLLHKRSILLTHGWWLKPVLKLRVCWMKKMVEHLAVSPMLCAQPARWRSPGCKTSWSRTKLWEHSIDYVNEVNQFCYHLTHLSTIHLQLTRLSCFCSYVIKGWTKLQHWLTVNGSLNCLLPPSPLVAHLLFLLVNTTVLSPDGWGTCSSLDSYLWTLLLLVDPSSCSLAFSLNSESCLFKMMIHLIDWFNIVWWNMVLNTGSLWRTSHLWAQILIQHSTCSF